MATLRRDGYYNTSQIKRKSERQWKNRIIDKRYIRSNYRNQKAKNNTFKFLKINNCQKRILHQVKLLFTNEREIKTF